MTRTGGEPSVATAELRPGYRISRLVKGGWQLAGDHGPVEFERAVADMTAFVDAGIDTFDCADIYTGVEEMIGAFLARLAGVRGAAERFDAAYAAFPPLDAMRGRKANVLSGGQRRMLAIARALVPRPELLLLDEPTAGLAPKVAAEVFDLVRDLAGRGVAVLMVEQNARAALALCDRGYVLAEGLNRIEGPAAELAANDELGAIFLGRRRAGAAGGAC